MSYKPKSLFRIIEEINKEIFLPHIQRPFVWEEHQMLRLFDSLMKSYPIQTFLFWRTKDQIKVRKFMPDLDWDAELSKYYDEGKTSEGVEKVLVLDGQQRLQTLYSIFSGSVILEGKEKGRSEAYFDITSGNSVEDDGISYQLRFSSEQLDLPWYRLANLLGKDSKKNGEKIGEELNEALDLLSAGSAQEQKKAREKRVRYNLSQLLSLLREEQHFWVQELDGVANEYPYKTVLDIFVRVNSGGTKLDSSDLMFAAMKEGWDEIEESIEQTTEVLNSTGLKFDKTFPLKCLLVVHNQGAEASPQKFDGESGASLLIQMKEHWEAAEAAFLGLRDFLKHDLKINSDKFVRSYNSFIPLFDFLYFNPKPNEIARAKMRGYFYKAQVFGWYSKGTDSVINAMHGLVGKPLKGDFPLMDIVVHFLARGAAAQLSEDHLEKSGLRAMLLNLIYVDRQGTSPFDVRLKGNEPHIDHIYPRHALLSHLFLPSSQVNSIGNFRFVGATDNIRKRAELPSVYFERLRSSGIQIERHLLVPSYSNDPGQLKLDTATYSDFRQKRLKMIWDICDRTINPENPRS